MGYLDFLRSKEARAPMRGLETVPQLSDHLCPLQLDVIRRALILWSNAGDTVLSPFAGIGSEGYVALREGRRFVGVELKDGYFRQATRNLEGLEAQPGLFA